ncbi:hypothetical protein L6W60_004305 [Salmonella enterica]|nr:hypothetical protein [Salmonella enterica]EHC5973208.1 hypothetical protein [Salmonella enterica]EIU9581673.1 hypothetical protein [Salmonella enterica]ELC1719900.1 hypothetical protein [Salmonella enterica]
MKKTLVALALAATTVSGSAMAWTANGTGGSVDLGGTLTPQANLTPWEILIGSAVANLNADIKIGSKVVDVPVKNSIPVLGIRTQTKQTFVGGPGLAPQIDFGGAFDVDHIINSAALLSMNVLNSKDNSIIGGLTVPMISTATSSWSDSNNAQSKIIYASKAGEAFFGGLSKNVGGLSVADSFPKVVAIIPDLSANFIEQGQWGSSGVETYTDTNGHFSGFYGAGIEAGNVMKLTLNAPAASDAITWKASLPVTVSYQ